MRNLHKHSQKGFRLFLGHENEYITPYHQASIEQPCSVSNGASYCFKYPLQRLQFQDSEKGHTYNMLLHVYNIAGHYISVKSPEFNIPSQFPPGQGVVVDVDPGNPDDSTDVDFVILSHVICGSWNGFWHHMNVRYEVAIGTGPAIDDTVNFQSINSSHFACVSASAISAFSKYYFIVRASCSGGSTITSSDGFVIINENILQQNVHVYNGKPCPRTNLLIVQTNSSFSLSSALVPLQIYTITLNCSAKHIVQSSDVIWLRNGVFTPSKSSPVFTLVRTSENRSDTCLVAVAECYESMNFTWTKNEIFSYWTLPSGVFKHVTSFKVSLLDSTDNALVALEKDTGKVMNFTFTNMDLLERHKYRTLITPCFGDVCTNQQHSDGIVAESNPFEKPEITITMSDKLNHTDIALEFAAFTCSSSGRARGYDVAVFDREVERRQISSWHVLQFVDDSVVKVYLHYIVNLFLHVYFSVVEK